MLNIDTDSLEKIKETFGMLVKYARRKVLSKNFEENDAILRNYINNLSEEEISSYLEQIQRYEQIAILTDFLNRNSQLIWLFYFYRKW